MIRGVLFDLGGVVLESPLVEIARFEANRGFETGLVNRTVREAGDSGAWARHERGEVDRESFVGLFARELAIRPGDVIDLMDAIEIGARPRPAMIELITALRDAGYSVAALTNNWSSMPLGTVVGLFDIVVESVVEGVRKPEPEIYRRTVERWGLASEEILYLDDLGANLKPARALGMTTIKVGDPFTAVSEVANLLAISLG